MSLLGVLVDGLRGRRAATSDEILGDERYWTDLRQLVTNTGMTLSPRMALQVSCVFQGTRLYAETLGSLPLIIYRELENGGKERLRDHYLWNLLRRQANAWQTAQQWRETMTAHALLWGAGYSEIISSPQSPVAELVPLDPDSVTPEQMANRRLRFRVREADGRERILVQEQVFRLEGLGITNRITPERVLRLAKEAVSLWLALEKFGALYFRQGARPGIVLKHPASLSEPALKRLRDQMQALYAGLENMHKVLVTEENMDMSTFGFNAKDSQMTEARDAQVNEVARWLNVPEHMLRAGKQPTFASIEQFAREWVDYGVKPWATRWEQAIDRDLVDADDVLAEHLFAGLLRGNTVDRANAYRVYVETGVMTRNEIRALENLNPLPGLDEPLTPLNMSRTTGQAPNQNDQQARRLVRIAKAAAARVARREAQGLRERTTRLVSKFKTSGPAFDAAVAEMLADFYREHVLVVAETLELEISTARPYCERRRAALGAAIFGLDGAAVLGPIDGLEDAAAAELTKLTLEEVHHAES